MRAPFESVQQQPVAAVQTAQLSRSSDQRRPRMHPLRHAGRTWRQPLDTREPTEPGPLAVHARLRAAMLVRDQKARPGACYSARDIRLYAQEPKRISRAE